MTNEEVLKIAVDLGWKDLGPQKNGMASFTREGFRANYYHTGTLTIQDQNQVYDKGRVWYKVTLDEAKEILK